MAVLPRDVDPRSPAARQPAQSPERGVFELQLGQLCNDRCVFCVSGLLTSRGKAPLLDAEVLCSALDGAAAAGYRRVTLLGGEPTIQPSFLEVVRHAVALGLEVVVFSNGSKAGRSDLIAEVAATGGRFEWRFSFQGATREAHERTTRRKGSFDQLLRAVERARAHGHRVTVNTCVVVQNHASLDRFPEVLLPRGVAQLHVDMVNPYDTGLFSADDGGLAVGPVGGPLGADENRGMRACAPAAPGTTWRPPGDAGRLWGHDLFAIMPRYTDLAGPLERMIAGFPAGFDVNVGNLPYCVAPHLAPFIHHGGPPTWTVPSSDRGEGALAPGRRKYLVKQSHKTKPETCRACVFDDRCTGVFDVYAERFGVGELRPVTPARLVEIDPAGRLFPRAVAATLARLHARAPFGALAWDRVGAIDGGFEITLVSPSGERVIAWIAEVEGRPRGGYRVEGTSGAPSDALVDGVRRLLVALGRLPSPAVGAVSAG